jgi:hypothetical protein
MGEVIWMEDAHLHPPAVTGFADRGVVQKLWRRRRRWTTKGGSNPMTLWFDDSWSSDPFWIRGSQKEPTRVVFVGRIGEPSGRTPGPICTRFRCTKPAIHSHCSTPMLRCYAPRDDLASQPLLPYLFLSWIILYLFFHDFRKINSRIKNFEKCTSDAVPNGGRSSRRRGARR